MEYSGNLRKTVFVMTYLLGPCFWELPYHLRSASDRIGLTEFLQKRVFLFELETNQ